MKTCVTEHFTHQPTIPSPKYPNLRFSSFLVEPLLAPSNRALIVIPHDGPHSAVIDAFNMNIAGFVRLDYSILVVNYRGSIGQGLSRAYCVNAGSLTSRFSGNDLTILGQDSIESLLGHIGQHDVSDVIQCVSHCLQSRPLLDPSKVDPTSMVEAGSFIAFS